MWTHAFAAVDVGRQIARARRAKGVTQAEFAEQLGVTRSTLSSLENGGPVALTTVMKALSYLGFKLTISPRDAAVAVTERGDV